MYNKYRNKGKDLVKTVKGLFNMLKKLADHKSSQCHVDITANVITFISYVTPVIYMSVINGKRVIECTGTYSATTRKQIGWFLKEYAPDLNYYDMKSIVGKGAVEM